MIVVIDGPSGSGKSSIAKAVANRLGLQYLDSGALYRAVTWIWLESGVVENRVIGILEDRDIQFDSAGDRFTVFVDGEEITQEIRTERVTSQTGVMAQREEIRNFVNGRMREAVKHGIWIADGRDLGSVVFPEAELKIFMDAPLELRASRRFKEQIESGEEITLEEVKRSLSQRDEADRNRSVAPLVKATDAIEVRNENLTFEQQVEKVATMIQNQIEN